MASLWHAQSRLSSVTHFVVQLKLKDNCADAGHESWMDGLVMLSVLEGILANSVGQPNRGKQRVKLVQRAIQKLMELFMWMAFEQSTTEMGLKEKRIRMFSTGDVGNSDEAEVDATGPATSFSESLMSVILLVLSALAGLLMKHCDTAVELQPLLKQLLRCVTDVAKSANSHLGELLSRPESSLVGAVTECLTHLNNGFLCLASCLSLNFCINEQLCSPASAEFMIDCQHKAGTFESLLSYMSSACALSSLPALPEARQIVLPFLSKLIRLSFMFLPKMRYHQGGDEERKTKKGARQMKQPGTMSVADMTGLPLAKLRPQLIDVLLKLVENSNSRHVQTHILSELSMRRYRPLVKLPTVLTACLKNFSSFHPSAQDIVLQFLHSCLLDNAYVVSFNKSRAFMSYLQTLMRLAAPVAVQVFDHLHSLIGQRLPAVVDCIIHGIVLPLLSEDDGSGLSDIRSLKQMSMAEIQQAGKEHLIKGAIELLVQSLDTLSVKEQCNCIQAISLRRLEYFLLVASLRSDCLKVLGRFAVEWKHEVEPQEDFWMKLIHEGTVKLLFELTLSDVTMSQSTTVELKQLDLHTVQFLAAVGGHVASLLWESDDLFKQFLAVSGPGVVAGQTARILDALSSQWSDETPEQQADTSIDETVMVEHDSQNRWCTIFSFIEAQLRLMSRSSLCTSVDYNAVVVSLFHFAFLSTILTYVSLGYDWDHPTISGESGHSARSLSIRCWPSL